MIKKYSLLILYTFLFLQVYAQEVSWRVLMNDPTISYYEVVAAFENQTKGKDLSKIKGSGKFQLYKNHYDKKVNGKGYYSERQARNEKMKFKNSSLAKSKSNDNWQYIGLDAPLLNMTGMWLGRVDRVTFHPTDSKILWAGTPAGGLWKSDDTGLSWNLISDTWPNLAIGDIIVDPSNVNNMYVATGDSDSWFFDSYGIQVSRDGGQTWHLKNNGLQDVTQIYRLVIDPSRPHILYCATEIGLFRSQNSGENWSKMTGINGRINDLELHPSNPDILHVAVTKNRGWSIQGDKNQTKSRNFDFEYYRSTDTGSSFAPINIGFESTSDESDDMLFGRIAVSPDNPNIVYIGGYANNGESLGALYKSEDAGLTFVEKAPRSTFTGTIGAWTMHLAVNPTDADDVIMGSVTAKRSKDGGNTWTSLREPELLHVDLHDMKWQPGTNRLFIANDGGLEYVNADGIHVLTQVIRVGQFAEMSSSPHGELIIGGMQDCGTRIKLPNGRWTFVAGGDGMTGLIDPVTERSFYASAQLGWTIKGEFSDNQLEYWDGLLFSDQEQQKATWETIIRMHPFKNNVLYIPFEDLFISEDFGRSFNKTSLSHLNFLYPPSILEISESDPSFMYISDGRSIAKSEDGGSTWSKVQDEFYISSLTIDHENPNKIWTSGWEISESINGGQTFRNLRSFFPNSWKSYVVHQPGSLDGIYALADGEIGYLDDNLNNWIDYSNNLPNTSFNSSDIDIITSIGKIRISTWGRGIWESDLFSNSPEFAKRIPKPPVLNHIDCGSKIEMSIMSNEDFDEVHWYKNDEFVAATTEHFFTSSDPGKWGARIINGAQKSYLSETVTFDLNQEELIGPDFVCEGSVHHFYIATPEDSSETYWNVPEGWEQNSLDQTSIGVIINSDGIISATHDVGCGIRNYTKEVTIIPICEQIVMDFDGEDDYLQIPKGLIDNVSDYTIETWIYIDQIPASHYAIYDLGIDWNARVHLRIEGDELSFRVTNWEDGWLGTIIDSNTKVSALEWFHVAVSYGSDDQIATIYLNGEDVGSAVMDREPKDLFSKQNLFIGRSLDYDNNTYFDGKMDEFRFWNISRSQDEIIEQMNCNLIGNETGLQVYYSFSDGNPGGDNNLKSTATDYNFKDYSGQLRNFDLSGPKSNYISVSDLIFSSSCIEVLECTILDEKAPVITIDSTVDIPYTLECRTELPLLQGGVNIFAEDDCDGDISQDIVLENQYSINGDCLTGPQIVTIQEYKVTDAAGNIATKEFSIAEYDTQAPIWNDSSQVLTLYAECGDDIDSLIALNIPSAQDECLHDSTVHNAVDVFLSSEISSAGCGNTFQRSLFYSVQDVCGNINPESFMVNIIVSDSTSPSWDVEGNELRINLECENNIDFLAFGNIPTASDACGSASVVLDSVSNAQFCGNYFEIIYSYSASDDCGNIVNEGFRVIYSIPISTGPVISGVPQDINISCNDPYPDTQLLFSNLSAFDVCDGVLNILGLDLCSSSFGDCFFNEDGSVSAAQSQIEHIYCISAQNSCGLTTEEYFKITIINDLRVDLGPDQTICDGEEVQLNAGTPEAVYYWHGPNDFFSQEQSPFVSQPGTYAVIVEGQNGCCQSDEINLLDGNHPILNLSSNKLNCNTSNISLNLSTDIPGGSYSWNGPNGFTSNEPNPQVTNPGTYSVIYTAENGCSSTESIVVEQDVELPQITAQGGTFNCNIESIQLVASSNMEESSFIWSGPNGFFSTDQFPLVFTSGTYNLKVFSPNGCSSTIDVIVSFSNEVEPAANFEFTVHELTVSFSDFSSGNPNSWFWDFGDGQTSSDRVPTHIYEQEGEYTVRLEVTNLCGSDFHELLVVVQTSNVQETPWLNKLQVFPNPNNGQFNLTVKGDATEIVNIALINSLGQTFQLENLGYSTGNINIDYSLKNLISGTYYIRIEAQKETFYHKLIIDHDLKTTLDK